MPTLTVAAPVGDRSLVDAARVRAELGVTPADLSDEVLAGWIRDDSDLVCGACRVAADQRRRRTFLEEAVTIAYTAAEAAAVRQLILPWRPGLDPATLVVAVDGVPLDPAAYTLDSDALLLARVDRQSWGGAVTIAGTAGWVMADVPAALRSAVIRLVRLRHEAAGRDLALKALSIEGSTREEYWIGGTGPGGSGIPADIMAGLRSENLVCPVIG
ncbi:hypothetical protein [Azospirillum thermophilum]|uniref:Uncharacterized protein n=1 Tax=Azospirillum thermophilum TaxID=2202148 RepID=A0A2S2D0S7_9PROT|nr:hypothetical protein [Azospirillum thermophilum]AWK90352.1 hypothetical protein DEW08_30530 [Azospirillum thermophilum]